MYQERFKHFSESLLVFCLFFISNASALFHIYWLLPEFVIIELAIWLILSIASIWYVKQEEKITIFVDTVKKNWFIFPFLFFSAISILWSVYWQISLYRWLIFFFTMAAGGYIGLKYNIKKIVNYLSIFGIFILVFSVCLVVIIPSVGVMNYHSIQGAWKGMFWHKNHMGFMATFVNILFLLKTIYYIQYKQKQKYIWGVLYIISLLFIFPTDSVGAYLTTIFLHGVILLAILLLKFGKKIQRNHYLIFIGVLLLTSVILYKNLDVFFGIFNRNTTLTGRIPMWSFLFKHYLSQKPYFGYGFNAFWYLEPHRVMVQYAAGYPDQIIIADNGYIDILINTGFVGLFLFAIFYFGVWWRSIVHSFKAVDIYDYFPVVLMSFTLISNISWSLMFENEGFFMLVMISILFNITGKTTKVPTK